MPKILFHYPLSPGLSAWWHLGALPCCISFIENYTWVWGYLYYIIIIENYIRVNWVYLIKGCTQVFDIVCHFVQEIITQNSITPETLQIENALQFV